LVYIFKQLDVYIPDLFGYKEIQTLFIVGALFHLLCEYTGVNVWYAKNYCKLLSNFVIYIFMSFIFIKNIIL